MNYEHTAALPLLEKIVIDNYKIKIINNELNKSKYSLKVLLLNIMKELNRNTEFHTYKAKQKRNFKVVLRYMHSSLNVNDISKEIEDHGYCQYMEMEIDISRSKALKRFFPCFILS